MFKIKELHYGLRNDSIIALPRCNFIKYVKYSILYEGATLWNALDKTFIHAQSDRIASIHYIYPILHAMFHHVSHFIICK